MKVLIVEDETVAFENLVQIINEIDDSIEIVGNTESIRQTISWLNKNIHPDLILMDIHLSDGNAFEIFQQITIEVPIIFTTAYDEYAIEAFKVNSVDYLLKPIKVHELEKSLLKFKKWTRTEVVQYLSNMSELHPPQKYIGKMLIPFKDQLIPVSINDISCFYTSDKNTLVLLKNGQQYSYTKTLEQIASTLNPNQFIRANKQYLIARNSVSNITIWFDNRLLLQLDIDTPEKIFVSKNKAAEFKNWMMNE
ncbi:LytR/AlgR family response regulator transcription factor [Plebeiibacterium sediminum]|uniref:LytTR family DNA-binding domain-containing protein n=1 Tax=Plebeiibacterium sediminum TaxID=2992112 RepID=A0AAE3SDJ0_9BACT|nr:LytTR family DNA-binding domain-containing protein [Plebeiobacterium sediminum]MCW3785280.1 LytTR family DNA-binding domain-containing protein [Plebeiobacterium sediminum]